MLVAVVPISFLQQIHVSFWGFLWAKGATVQSSNQKAVENVKGVGACCFFTTLVAHMHSHQSKRLGRVKSIVTISEQTRTREEDTILIGQNSHAFLTDELLMLMQTTPVKPRVGPYRLQALDKWLPAVRKCLATHTHRRLP